MFALKEEQVWLLELIETGQSLFYSGQAGTTKSAVIKALKDRMDNSKEIYFRRLRVRPQKTYLEGWVHSFAGTVFHEYLV